MSPDELTYITNQKGLDLEQYHITIRRKIETDNCGCPINFKTSIFNKRNFIPVFCVSAGYSRKDFFCRNTAFVTSLEQMHMIVVCLY